MTVLASFFEIIAVCEKIHKHEKQGIANLEDIFFIALNLVILCSIAFGVWLKPLDVGIDGTRHRRKPICPDHLHLLSLFNFSDLPSHLVNNRSTVIIIFCKVVDLLLFAQV